MRILKSIAITVIAFLLISYVLTAFHITGILRYVILIVCGMMTGYVDHKLNG